MDDGEGLTGGRGGDGEEVVDGEGIREVGSIAMTGEGRGRS